MLSEVEAPQSNSTKIGDKVNNHNLVISTEEKSHPDSNVLCGVSSAISPSSK